MRDLKSQELILLLHLERTDIFKTGFPKRKAVKRLGEKEERDVGGEQDEKLRKQIRPKKRKTNVGPIKFEHSVTTYT